MPGKLVLITAIANQLLEANASTAARASEKVLAQLVEHFDLHYSFLRYADHDIRESVGKVGEQRSTIEQTGQVVVLSEMAKPLLGRDAGLELCE